MRNRLIELLGDFPVWHSTLKDAWMPEAVDRLADYLLANGVIVPPCKVGQKVYMPDYEWGRIEAVIESIEITHIGLCYEWVKYDVGVDETEVWDDGTFRDKDIGKTVFLSFEEYEKALKERSEG